jgi:uncharacterized protein (DUF1800 family)
MAKFWAKLCAVATLAAMLAGVSIVPAAALPLEEARHLLQRTGFGALPSEIARLAPLDRAASVELLLAETRDSPTLPPPAFLAEPWPRYRDFPDMREEERQPFIQARRDELQTLKAWWYAEMIATPSPLAERMTLFWHNHFVSNFEGVGFNVHRIWDQHALFRREATGSFETLLREILRDPIMLRYLDNHTNRKSRPNENLARELLELFTLGEGNYTELDVKETARALTGRTLDRSKDFGYQFVRGIHDESSKRILGVRADDGDDVARILLAHKRTAEFIAEKLWREFVSSDPAPAAEIAAVADAIRANGYQIKPGLRRLFLSEAFWAPANRGTLIKSPVAMIVGAYRDLALPIVDLQALPVHGRRLGQDLFEPPNVKGWPGGSLWITPASLVARYDVLGRLLDTRSLVPARPADGMQTISLRVAGDAYRGPPHMIVKINGDHVIAARDIEFATDSVRFGNLPDRNDWAWRVLSYPVDRRVVAVSIAFDNDAAAPADANGVKRGDRNLFVDWVEVEGRVYPAREGRQESPNPSCHNQRPGDLHCNATLTFDIAALKAAGKGRPADMGAEAANANMMAPNMMAPNAMRPSRRPIDPTANLNRPVNLSADAWLASLPAEWQTPDRSWRSLMPLAPVGRNAEGDAEGRLRSLLFDPAYQLM